MDECEHGVTTTRTTRDGWPLCALCRRLAKRRPGSQAALTPRVPKIAPPRADYAAITAGDVPLWKDDPHD